MLQCASAFTYEIDDCEAALREIQGQLAEKLQYAANTVGIVMCHPEYLLSGTLSYICDNLPFDVVGVTTASQAVNDAAGEMILTLFVMTSDDVIFRTGITESLASEIDAPTRAAYGNASEGIAETPKLVLAFPPLILENAGDLYPKVWSTILPNTPVFGTIAIDDTVSFSGSETIYKGQNSATQMTFVLCYGNIHPRFLVGVLPESNAMPYQGEVTKSNGPFVSEINNINAYQYFENLGFAAGGAPTDSFLFVPFMLDLKKRADYDGIPVLRVLTSFTEDGTAIFRGNMDENSIFTLSRCSEHDVVSTAVEKLEQIKEIPDVHGALIFSCIIRRMVLGSSMLAELSEARDRLSVPFMMGYAGGEICPTSVKNDVPSNRFHNYTFISLLV